jgi:hypothetical protein
MLLAVVLAFQMDATKLNFTQPIVLTNFARQFIYYITTTNISQLHLLTDGENRFYLFLSHKTLVTFSTYWRSK